VDGADSAPPLYQRIRGLPSRPVPEAAFWTAALRELFEETGILMARDAEDEWSREATAHHAVESLRRSLMDDEITMMDVLEELGLTLDASGMVHIAHWVTPVVEPRRYDTHFFVAALPEGRTAAADPREMTDSRWIAPAAALERFEQGELPMVFPTVRTLETLRSFRTVEDVLASFRGRTVARILPRLVRTASGVAIVTDE
jgi:8-oxo-dGTP pyrophosphatase MutT (NUDIX family)